MGSGKHKINFVALGANMVLILSAVSLVSMDPSEKLAAATTAANNTSAANATSTREASLGIVIMPLGSSSATSGEGYDPNPVTVSAGSSLIWENQDNALHTATSGNPKTATPDGEFDTGIIGANQQSKPVTMPAEPGNYTYFCTLHPFLVGTVTVQ
jgi:plastocyanin